MARSRTAALDFLSYLALRSVIMFFHLFPINRNLKTARWMGRIWHGMPRWVPLLGRAFAKHRERADAHLRLAFPEWSAQRRRAACRSSMESMAMLAVEVLSTPRLITPWTWARHVRLHNFEEALRILLDRRGCIMLTAHYGNWELLGYTLATLGFEVVAVMRPLDNARLNDYLMGQREPSGMRLLYKKGASQSMDDVLEDGAALCFIADQNAGDKGLFVDFFGTPASTYKSIGLLAIRHRVPIIVGYARRLGGRFDFEIGVSRIIRPEEWDGREDELRWVTQEYSAAMEAFVREAPDQYLWIHRRWKSRPKHEREAAALATGTAAETHGPAAG